MMVNVAKVLGTEAAMRGMLTSDMQALTEEIEAELAVGHGLLAGIKAELARREQAAKAKAEAAVASVEAISKADVGVLEIK